MIFRRFILVASLVTLFSAECKTVRTRDMIPGLERGRVIYSEGARKPTEAELAGVDLLLKQLLSMVQRKDWNDLPGMVSKKKGIYVDLKGFRSFAQLEADVRDHGSYLYVFYHDTDILRAFTHDRDQIAVREVLMSGNSIRVDYYMEEGSQECELALHVSGNEKEDYRLNHPVFIREDGVWKVYRLF